MTDYKFCDLHKTAEGRQTAKESVRTVIVQEWKKVDGKNRLFENKVDVCLACLKEQIVDRAVGNGVPYASNWKTEVWQTGASGKKYTTLMSPEELEEHLKKEAKEKEIQELRAKAMGR